MRSWEKCGEAEKRETAHKEITKSEAKKPTTEENEKGEERMERKKQLVRTGGGETQQQGRVTFIDTDLKELTDRKCEEMMLFEEGDADVADGSKDPRGAEARHERRNRARTRTRGAAMTKSQRKRRKKRNKPKPKRTRRQRRRQEGEEERKL